jgi:glyoxylase-like metal-dependent hydrolase (beta-lactamase superfamily II)
MSFSTLRLSDRISLIQEAGVAGFLRCNIWHVRGRDCDLVIDTGMGLGPLKDWVRQASDRPLKAICTHCHFDHMGSLHEFDCRLGHRAEAQIFADPAPEAVVYSGDWARIEIVSPALHPDFRPQTWRITPAPLTGHLDEGDVLDLGDAAYQVLHVPGPSPGSIALWDRKARTVFSGDAVYDGALLDWLYHSDPHAYRQTLERLRGLEADVFHGGHYPSFGKARLNRIVDAYLRGHQTMGSVMDWYNEATATTADLYAPQDWSSFPRG